LCAYLTHYKTLAFFGCVCTLHDKALTDYVFTLHSKALAFFGYVFTLHSKALTFFGCVPYTL